MADYEMINQFIKIVGAHLMWEVPLGTISCKSKTKKAGIAFQKRSIFSKTRIDTDASSRHSEDLFASREVTTEISTKVNTDIHVFSRKEFK